MDRSFTRRATDADDPACIDLLKQDLAKMPAQTVPELGWRLDRFMLCFLEFTRISSERVGKLGEGLQAHGEEEIELLRKINEQLNEAKQTPKDPPQLGAVEKAWIYFRDRVLPALITALIVGAAGWFMFADKVLKELAKHP